MMKILIVLAVVLLGGGGAYYYMAEQNKAATQDTHAEGEVHAHVLSKEGITIGSTAFVDGKLQLEVDGGVYTLAQVPTGSGIRYESADGTVIYAEHQGSIAITTPVLKYEGVTATEATVEVVEQRQMDAAASEPDQTATQDEQEPESYDFMVDGEVVAEVLYEADEARVTVDGQTHVLTEVAAEAGEDIRYENADGSVVLVQTGGEVTLTQDDVVLNGSTVAEVEAVLE